jgi:hypothetical protein
MLRLTRLAPDIIEAILRGDEPDGLSLEKLRKNLPVRWDEQREAYAESRNSVCIDIRGSRVACDYALGR